jgi:drug/metabolite transporter (DMT)-like permease
VANNSILFGTGPFLTAGIAWLMIRERPSVATLVFSGFALLGAMMVVGNSLQVSADSVFGDLLAVLMTITFAAKTVLVRKHPELPMVHASAFGALLGSIGALPFVPSWAITWGELAIFALFGLCQQGAGMILTTLGIRHVPAAHSALLMSLDVPMSPMWVWLAFGELPGRLAVAGGGVVLAAIVGHIVVEGRRRRT